MTAIAGEGAIASPPPLHGERAGIAGSAWHAAGYRADIDGVRAIAVLLVVVFHFGLLPLGDAGFIGVDLFFVISGYLISNIIWRDLEAGSFSLGRFYARRIRRLAPALIAVQLGALLVGAVLLLPHELTSMSRETIVAQLYVSNIYYWRTLSYFGLQASSAFMLHSWSLAVEEQFYLFYPLMLMTVHRWCRPWFWWVLAAVALASFALNLALVGAKPQLVFYLLPTRAWELAAGALLPLAEPVMARRAAARTLAGIAGLAAIAIALASYRLDFAVPGSFALLPVAGGVGLLLAGTGAGSPVARMLAVPPLLFFGRISYAFYLVHWPLHVLAKVSAPDYGLAVRWAMFFVSIVLAYAITRFIEAPVRERRILAGNRPLVAAYLAALGLILLAATLVIASGGWRERFAPAVLRLADDTGDRAEGSDDARRGNAPLESRLSPLGMPEAGQPWFVYGDSHANALRDAVSIALARRGEGGDFVYQPNCMPVLDSGTRECRALNRQAVDHAAGRRVLLVSIWREPLEPGYRGSSGRAIEGAAAVADARRALVSTIAALRRRGAEVFVWLPLPSAPHNVPAAAARNRAFGPWWAVSAPLATHRARLGWVAEALDAAKVPADHRIDPAPALCPGGTCRFVRDGRPIYSDNNHPAAHTAPLFAGLLARALPPPAPQRSRSAVPPASAIGLVR